MNWTEEKSLRLTRWCTRLVLVLCLVFAVAAVPFWGWFLASFRPEFLGRKLLFVLTSYVVLVPALTALLLLLRLLANLQAHQVFIPQNVLVLRRISWCCAAAFVICGLSALYYIPFAVFAGAFGLMALLLNAVKNCFGQAVSMKDELDYTV